MRKFISLLFVAMTASAVMATDYDVPIIVIVNGETSEQSATITVNDNDGLYDLTLKNFVLQAEGSFMGVGNVALTGIKPYQDGNATLLIAAKQVTITDGDDASVGFWMASMLPPVDVLLRRLPGIRFSICCKISTAATLI